MGTDRETSIGLSYGRVEIPEPDSRTLLERRRDRIFYALVLGLIQDYESLVTGTYKGRIPELGADREVPGAHGAIITYNCTFGPSTIDFFDAERWDTRNVKGAGAPLSVRDIPTEKEGVLEFIARHFYGENARIFEGDELIYTSAKLSNISKLERIAKRMLHSQAVSASDLVWHSIGGAKEPNYKTGKYGNRTLASFASAFFAGGYVYMRDMTQASEVSPGQVYEFGFDGLVRAVGLKANLDARKEDCLDLHTMGGFENVCLVLTEYAPKRGGEVRPVSRRLLAEDDVLCLLGGTLSNDSFWERMKQGMDSAKGSVGRKLRQIWRNIRLV